MRIGALVKHWSERILSRERALLQTYASFRSLLAHDISCHELLAEFEALFHGEQQEDVARTRFRYQRLARAVEGMVRELERMHPGQAHSLRDYFSKYDFYIRLLLEPPEQFLIPPYTVGQDELAEASLIGNKSRNLTLVRQVMAEAVPAGFTITSTVGELLLAHNGLRPAIDRLLATINPQSLPDLETVSQALITLITRMEVPDTVAQAILDEYDTLAAQYPQGAVLVAVRSSGAYEDGLHSFAGQYRSLLGVQREGLLAAYLEVLASRYSPEALQYRIRAGVSDEEAAMAVLVLAMVDAVASGVMYTRSPGSKDQKPLLLIQSAAGLGLPLVGGEMVPDAHWVDRTHATVEHAAGQQDRQLVLAGGVLADQAMDATGAIASRFGTEQALHLAQVGLALERLFGEPQDVEWALDGEQRLFILQSRPMAQTQVKQTADAQEPLAWAGQPLLTGAIVAASGVCSGRVQHYDPLNTALPVENCVLITRHLPPSLARYADRLVGVVCTGGAVTGHFASICRELGIVLLVEAAEAFTLLAAGREVIVDGSQGAVYAGKLPLPDRSQKQRQAQARLRRNRRLWQLHDYITPLHLIDPWEETFRPQNCKSLHDIVRYAHEKAVQVMFGLSDLASDKNSRCRLLQTDLALDVYLIDLGGGLTSGLAGGQPVLPEQIVCRPFTALWRGLSHPDIDWQSHQHFDWQGFSDMALSGGMALGGVKAFATYAVVSAEYCNVNLRFGFHFTVLDCLCGKEARANYCQLRFAGGGGDYHGRSMRIALLQTVLVQLGFEVSIKADLLDARISMLAGEELARLLTVVGHLLGMTKLLDMTLKKPDDVQAWVDSFFQQAEPLSSSTQP